MKHTKELFISISALLLFPLLTEARTGTCEYRVQYQIKTGFENQVLKRFENCGHNNPCENTKDNQKKLVREGDSLRIWHTVQNANACTASATNQCRLGKDIAKTDTKFVEAKTVSVNFDGQILTTDICQNLAKASPQQPPTSPKRSPARAKNSR